jgi:hypothetical protein
VVVVPGLASACPRPADTWADTLLTLVSGTASAPSIRVTWEM